MIKKLKSIFLKVSIAGVLVAPILSPVVTYAQTEVTPNPQGAFCGGSSTLQFGTAEGTDCDTATQGSQDTINTLIANIINIFSIIVGLVAVVMLIYGGFKYISSGGDSGNITAAKNTILYAIIGLVIVAMAQIIVKWVMNRATQASAT